MPLEIVASLPPSRISSSTDDASPARVRDAAGAGHGTRGGRRHAHDALAEFLERGVGAGPGRETLAAFALRDVAVALIDLGAKAPASARAEAHGKAILRSYDEPWELCVERFGPRACLSVYRATPEPLVAIYDRAVRFDDVVAAVDDTIAHLLAEGATSPNVRLELESALAQLREKTAVAESDGSIPEPVPMAVEPDRDAPVSFGAEFALRAGAGDDAGLVAGPAARLLARDATETVERSDVHALLFRGRMRAEVRGRSVDLGECHPVLVAERLVELARRAFDAWERGLALHSRGEAAGVVVGIRLSTEGELALTLGPKRDSRGAVHTFPALGVVDVLEAALTFGRSLVRAILRRDRSQSANLRLSALRRSIRESTEALRHASQSDAKVNPSPEPYRAFAAALHEAQTARAATPASATASRLRYSPRWRAIVPGIDLRATYLCGDRLIVSAAAEMWALDRQNGRVLWRVDVPRGTSVVTPGGIARLTPDGTLAVYAFDSGERVLRTRIAPRVGGPVAGAVVHMPGLPRLVVVTEGEHHLVAVDLTTGETRWRWSWGKGRGAPRIKRAGRLLYFTCGDGALTALDVMTGAVVWRVRDRLRFRTPPVVAHDALFAASGGAHGVARLYCIDPYAGDVRWSASVGDPGAPCTIEGAPLAAAGTVGVAVRASRRSPGGAPASALTLVTFRAEDGSPLAGRGRLGDGAPSGVAPAGTSWLAVDDVFVGNTPTGEIIGVDARSGSLRWRHVLGPRPLEADLPRRLEPVLRCGALFVPCSLLTPASNPSTPRKPSTGDATGQGAAGVCIVRPADGALLGTIAPSEAIPDLLRVDEHCNVYVAEESGHLAAFGAMPRLSLVKALT